MKKGLTLVEVVVGVALFLVIAMSVYKGYTAVYSVVNVAHVKVTASNLINEQFEIIRNLPYADVGVINSIPDGVLIHEQTLVRDNTSFIVTTTVRNTDDPFDGLIGGSPNDLSPADYKLVEIELECPTCKNFPGMKITSRVAAKSLETASTNGALFIQVLDANGQPVTDADVHIENNQVNPALVIDDVTNTSGMLQIVDVPPGVNAYEIEVTKNGYTSDQTYLVGAPANPNPLKPHATVALQQVTQITFVIDHESTLKVSSITTSCSPVPSVDFLLEGSRLIGSNPDIKKYSASHVTDAGGKKTISGIQWDTYSLSLTDGTYDLVGMNPLNPFNVIADTTQDIDLIVASKDPKSLLVSVRDAVTQLPVSDATVILGLGAFEETLTTGQGFSTQTDWSGGGGQDSFSDPTRFFDSDGNIEINNPAGELKLRNVFGTFFTDGNLTSSTFDTGTTSNFSSIVWEPIGQPPDTGADNVRFRIATNEDELEWDFIGPDGTENSYYSLANSNLSSAHNGDRYLRYKLFLNTASTTLTPNISDISFTYTSSCIPPGQALFSGLDTGTYSLEVSKSGYETIDVQVPVSANWQQYDVTFLPD